MATTALLLLPCSAFADTWTGATDADWNTGSNWADSSVPTSSDLANISGGSAIISGGSATGDLVLVGAGSDGTLTIRDTLTSTSGTIANWYGVTGSVAVETGGTWTMSSDLAIASYGTATMTVSGGGDASAGNIYLGAIDAVSDGTLTVTGSGSTVTTTGDLIVGHVGTGTLSVTSSGRVEAANAAIGNQANATGTATVSGGTLDIAGTLFVGSNGTGSLTIRNGGTVSDTVGNVGSAAGTTNTVSVTGNGSQWSNSSILLVGVRGTGTLNLSAGGDASAGSLVIGRYAGSTGTVTVNGSGSTLTVSGTVQVGGDLSDSATRGGSGTLTLRNGGRMTSGAAQVADVAEATGSVSVSGGSSSWTINGDLGIGHYGTGSLTIDSGATVSNVNGRVGHQSGATGTVVVSGAGSTWDNSGVLYVGINGTGSLSVRTGATVSATDAYAGTETDSSGKTSRITVSGRNATLDLSGTLFVAHNGRGALTLSQGGTVTSDQGIVGDLDGSSGTATISGAGSAWTVAGDMNVGRLGAGTLTLSQGGAISADRSYIGNETSATGTATVSGSGTRWTSTNNMAIGSAGTGSLDLSDGATVTATDIVVGLVDGGVGTSTIHDGGIMSDTTGIIGKYAGSTGTVTLRDQGTRWTNSESFTVGQDGRGTLTVSRGATVSSGDGFIGTASGASGEVSIAGSGSAWTSAGTLTVGEAGTGVLTLASGGAVSAKNAKLGASSGGSGEVSIAGSGSAWTSSGTLTVGEAGTGVLTLASGGAVSAKNAKLGASSGGSGTVSVSGSSSAWTSSGTLTVGEAGTGVLTLASGASLSAKDAILGASSVGSGEVSIAGSGSSWTSSGTLTVGEAGTGTVVVTRGGSLTAETIVLAAQKGSSGTLVIGAEASQSATAPGSLNATRLRFGAGSGTLVLNHTGTNLEIGAIISGNGRVRQIAGATTLSGANTFSGGVSVEGGTLRLGNDTAAGSGDITLADGTTLAYADGVTVDNDLIITSGTVALLVARGDTATQSGSVSGDGLYVVGGGGKLTVTGDRSGFTGETQVTDGVLSVNGTLGGTVYVGSGGRLQGSGTVRSTTIDQGGVVAPGNSIGALTVKGTLTFNSGSTYEVEVTPGGSSTDTINVTGKAVLTGAKVAHVGFNGTYAPVASYTILTAEQGLEGRFAGVTTDYLFLDPSLVYTATTVDLRLERNNIAFGSAATTPNQQAVAQALDSIGAGANATVYNAVSGLTSAAAARRAFNALSGEIHAGTLGILAQDGTEVRNALLDRGRLTAGDTGPGVHGWASTFGAWGSTAGDGNAAGLDHSGGGVVVGLDAVLPAAPDWRLGLAAAQTRTDYSIGGTRASDGEADSTHIGLYGGGSLGPVALRGGATAAFNRIETSRAVSFAGIKDTPDAGYDALTEKVFGEVASGMALGGGVAVEPFGGLTFTRVLTDSFDEQGRATALKGDAGTFEQTVSSLGMRLDARLDGVMEGVSLHPRAHAAWDHVLHGTTPTLDMRLTAGGDGFTVAGPQAARDALRLGIGVDARIGDALSVGLAYDGRLADGDTVHGVTGRLSVRF